MVSRQAFSIGISGLGFRVSAARFITFIEVFVLGRGVHGYVDIGLGRFVGTISHITIIQEQTVRKGYRGLALLVVHFMNMFSNLSPEPSAVRACVPPSRSTPQIGRCSLHGP